LFGAGLIAASFGLTAAVYTRLPDPMPTHFDFAGHADGFTPKPIGPFVLPAIGLLIYVVTSFIPAIARGRSAATLQIIPICIAAFFLFLTAVILRTALGGHGDLPRLLLAGISLFVAVLGNYFGKLRRNRWIGIRTPWTLADDEVWLRTHRLGGWLFVAGGSLSFLGALGGAPVAAIVGLLAALMMIPAVYSYVIFRRIRTQGDRI
jgi:uncharacterized membrane protein